MSRHTNPAELNNLELDSWVDITQQFFETAKNVKHGNIVKLESLDLMEGTDAKEILNPALDTGLIEDESYDCDRDLTLDETVRVVANITSCLVTWLDSSSLPVTLFSCRYIEEILTRFSALLSSSTIVEKIFQVSNLQYSNKLDQSDSFTYRILRAYLIGVLNFTAFVLNIPVLKDEEDLNRVSMDLNIDLLLQFPQKDVADLVNSAYSLLEKRDDKNSKVLQLYFDILKRLQMLYPLSASVNQGDFQDTLFLHEATGFIDKLSEENDYIDSIPQIPHLFTRGIQKRKNNIFPPRPIKMHSFTICISYLHYLFDDLKLAMDVLCFQDAADLRNRLYIFGSKRNEKLPDQEHTSTHIVAALFLESILLRDGLILGAIPVSEFLKQDLSSLTAGESVVLSLLEDDKLTNDRAIKARASSLLQEMEKTYISWIQSFLQNPSKQRDFFLDSVVVWDTIQVTADDLETSLPDDYGLEDTFKSIQPDGSLSELPVMPLSSYVYYMKLDSMVQVVFRGIELEIYKPWEMYQMYWYGLYLLSTLESHIARMKDVAKYKLSKAEGESKDIWKKTLDHINFLIQETIVFKTLAQAQQYTWTILDNLKLLKLPKYNRTTPQLLYQLRMKPFSSVGIPQLPSIQHFQNFADEIAEGSLRFRTERERVQDICFRCSSAVRQLTTEVKTAASQLKKIHPSRGRFKADYERGVDQILRSSIGVAVFSTKVNKKIKDAEFVTQCLKENPSNQAYDVSLSRAQYHRFFPPAEIKHMRK
ncbi:GQ67_02769T0 [Komagataella phaffii]|nr:GQ67_02769T0 [Komagataella phaffii]AOA65595.1 GQ68_02479T0 [Komagataella phaffii GS115]